MQGRSIYCTFFLFSDTCFPSIRGTEAASLRKSEEKRDLIVATIVGDTSETNGNVVKNGMDITLAHTIINK